MRVTLYFTIQLILILIIFIIYSFTDGKQEGIRKTNEKHNKNNCEIRYIIKK